MIVPAWLLPVSLAVGLALAGVQTVRLAQHDTAHAEYVAEVEAANRAASEAARIKEKADQRAYDEAAEHARDEIQALQADVSRLADVGDGLRDELAGFKRRAVSSATAAGRGPGVVDSGSLDMLAILYSRADTEAGILAGYADRLRIAGSACEAAADKVSR